MVVDYDRVIARQLSEEPHHHRQPSGARHSRRYGSDIVAVEPGLPSGIDYPTPEQCGVYVHSPKLLIVREGYPLCTPEAAIGLVDDGYWQPGPRGYQGN